MFINLTKKLILNFVKIVYTFIKVFQKVCRYSICNQTISENPTMKKITTPSHNRCESVELILRGAKKRRMLAYATAASVNTDAGFKANLRAVK